MTNKYVGLEQYKRSIDSIKEYVDKSIPYIGEPEVIFTLPADKVLEIYNSESKSMEFDKPSNINLDYNFIVNYNNENIIDVSIMDNGNIKGIVCNNNGIIIIFVPGYDINQNINENKMVVIIENINTSITPTDVILKQMQAKYLNNKYLKNDVAIKNSITIGSRLKRKGYGIGQYSFSNGKYNISSGYNSHAEGNRTTASGYNSHAEGNRTTASEENSHTEGYNTEASGYNSHAEGSGSVASGNSSHAEGYNTEASGDYSHAEGYNTIASGSNSHVQGRYNIKNIENKYAHIVGNGTSNAARSNAHTLDWSGNAWYQGKLSQDGTPAEDKDLTTKKYVDDKVASLVNSAPETLDTLKELSTALGDDPNFATTVTNNLANKAEKDHKHNDIYAPIDSPNFTTSISMGRKVNSTVGANSIAIGYNVIASKNYSHAEGNTTYATGPASHAEGKDSIASKDYSHAEGLESQASGIASHAEGSYTRAEGDKSHAEGDSTQAKAVLSHAEGFYTRASSALQHVQGKYNIEDTEEKYAHIVGNGTVTSSSNAHTLDWSGNAWYQGSVYTGGTGQDDANAKKLATEEYVNSNKVTKTSELTNDSGFITSIPDEYITETELNSKGYLTEHQDLSEYAPINSPNFTNAISMGRLSSSTVGKNSTALGGYVQATADYSHAEGQGSIARGNYSHAEGSGALSEGIGSHAENAATARGNYSHAEGSGEAIGVKSHAEGHQSKANGEGSHAEGYNTVASGEYQHVQGKYNIEDSTGTYAHIIGNGTGSSSKSNAHTVDWSGNAWYKGKISQDGTPTDDKDLTTKKYVDDKVASLVNSAPETLDTLKELSTALGDDPNFATTMTTALGNKVDKVDGKTLSTNDLTNELKANYDAAYTHSQVAHFDGDYNNLSNKPSIPSKVSELTNDSGFLTSIPSEYITETELTAKNYIDNTMLESKGYLTKHQDLSSYALKTELHSHDNKTVLDIITDTKITEWDSKSTFSGSYNDLTDKPDIPSIDGLATETYVKERVNQVLITPEYNGDLILTTDEYQYVTNINDTGGVLVIFPYTNELTQNKFIQIHLIIDKSSGKFYFDNTIIWRNNDKYDGEILLNDNTYEFIFTFVNNYWIGEYRIHTRSNQTKFKSSYTTNNWVLNNTTSLYELTVNHNLNTSNISLSVRNTTDNYDMFIDYEVINENNIKIISDEASACSVKILAF